MTRPAVYMVTPKAGAPYRVTLSPREAGWSAVVERDGERWCWDLVPGPQRGSARAGDRPLRWRRDAAAGTLALDGDLHELAVASEAAHRLARAAPAAGAGPAVREVRAPMPGLVVAALIEEEGEVTAGQGVLVIEAMKMENVVAAPADGVVRGIAVRAGQVVEKGTLLFRVEAAP